MALVTPAPDDLFVYWKVVGSTLAEKLGRAGDLAGALDLDTDTSLAANSDTKIPSQKAVKAYIDAAVTSTLQLLGDMDCSGNPNYPAAAIGDSYIVSVAGKIGGASGVTVGVGDVFGCSTANGGGTQAAVGADWFILPHSLVGALLVANDLSDVSSPATAVTNLFGAASTGTGGAVRATSPTLVTPVLGVATATSINGNTITTGTGVLTLGAGKTLTASNTLTLTATDGSTLAVGTGGTLGSAAFTSAGAYDAAGSAAAALAASQPLDADLTAIAALATTSFGRGGLTQADAAAYRAYIGVGTGTGDMVGSNNLSELTVPATARTNLGLGTLATQSGTFSGTSSGTNTGDQTITLTGNVTGSGTGSFATTIAAGAVTLAMQANMSTASVIYRKTAGAGAPEVQTLATLKTDLGLTGTNSGDQTSIVGITGTIAQFNTACTDADFSTGGGTATGTNTGDQTITLTGGVTGSGTGSFAATVVTNANLTGNVTSVGNATTIAAGVVTLAMQANMATASVVYRKTAGAGPPEVQTLATLKSDLNLTGTNSGDQTSIVGITGTIAQFNAACSDADFTTGGGTATGTNTGDQTSVSGNAGTATALQTARTINGVSFDGTASITVPAAAGTLTGATLAAGVTGSSLTSFGAAPALGAATATSINGNTITTGTGTLTLSTFTLTVSGTASITGTNTGDQTTVSGNAGTATALQTGRTLAITGDLAWTSPTFDGTGNVTAAGTLATVNSNVGAFGSSTAIPTVTVNAKGLVTAVTTNVVVAPAGTLSGATLNATVLASSLTSVGTLTGGATGSGFTVALSTSTVTGTLGLGNGGTGQTSAAASFDALNIHGADVVAATTTNLDTATGNLVDVTGTTTITAITLSDGRIRTVRFTGILTLTNGASLVLPGGANITTAAGDVAIFRGYAAGVVRCVSYSPIGVTGTGSTVLAASPTLTGVPAAPTAAALTSTTQIATTAFAQAINNNAAYRTILSAAGSHTAAKIAGTYAMGYGDPIAVSGTGTLYPLAVIQIVGADYPTVNGLATKLRIRAQLFTNDVAPTGNFTFGLYPITRPATSGGAGLCIYTLGTVVTGSNGATFTTPAADGLLSAVGADFAIPADGPYVIGVVTTGTIATSAHVHLNAQLQMRNA